MATNMHHVEGDLFLMGSCVKVQGDLGSDLSNVESLDVMQGYKGVWGASELILLYCIGTDEVSH
jgi:hypothetical protein